MEGKLSKREKRVLLALLDIYIKTAEPVGSRILARKYDLGISPATIRNTMSDLEDMGYLLQPYTSAGRIPTDKAYRFYIDRLMKFERLSRREENTINQEVTIEIKGLEDILSRTCTVLANITHQLSLAISPNFENGILKRINAVSVADKKVLLIVTIESGYIKTMVIEFDAELNAKNIIWINEILNERLAGLTLKEIKDTIRERLNDTGKESHLLKVFINTADKIFSIDEKKNIHMEGTTNILLQPEFKEQRTIVPFIQFVEKTENLAKIFSRCKSGEDFSVIVGSENIFKEVNNLSIVSCSYKFGDSNGTIGVIGPTRMRYSKMIPIVKFAANRLSSLFLEQE